MKGPNETCSLGPWLCDDEALTGAEVTQLGWMHSNHAGLLLLAVGRPVGAQALRYGGCTAIVIGSPKTVRGSKSPTPLPGSS